MKHFSTTALIKSAAPDDWGDELIPNSLLDTRKRTILADFFYPWSSNRAGRAHALADLSGQKTPARIRYPQSMRYADILRGAAAGAGLGYAGAKLNREFDIGGNWGPDDRLKGVIASTLLGGGAGYLYNVFKSRQQMRAIKNIENGDGDAKVSLPSYSPLENILLPASGPHRLGYSEIAEDLLDNGEPTSRKNRHLANAATLAASNIPVAGVLAPLIHGIGSNNLAQKRMERLLFDPEAGNKADEAAGESEKEAHTFINKSAVNSGLTSLGQGGEAAMLHQALSSMGMARAAVAPNREKLKAHGLSGRGYDSTLSDLLTNWSGDKSISELAKDKGQASPFIGAGAGGAAGGLAGLVAGGAADLPGPVKALMAAVGVGMGGGVGYFAGRLHEDSIKKRYLNTAKMLKQHGVLTPDHLRMSAPMLRHDPDYRMIM